MLLFSSRSIETARSSARAKLERQRAERAEQTQLDAIPQLRAMGLSVEQVAQALSLSEEEVRRHQ